MSRYEHATQPELDPELLRAYCNTFINRWDTYPVQNPKDGKYFREKDYHTGAILPLRPAIVERHVRGQGITIGVYMLDAQSNAKSLVFDADDEEQFLAIKAMAYDLQAQKVPTYVEQSRRGGHVWMFFEPISGVDARRFGNYLKTDYHLDGVELYPKQDHLTETNPVGSLVRLPLGLHRHPSINAPTRFGFLDREELPLAPTVREQMALLAHPNKVPQLFIEGVLALAPDSKPRFSPPSFSSRRKQQRFENLSPDKKIKTAISPYDFIGQYVDLDTKGHGLCPFHDDHHNSFAVYESNWWCFACEDGGSIIDFYKRLKGYAREYRLPLTEWNDLLKEMMELLRI